MLLTRSDAILHNIHVVMEINSGLPPVWGDKVPLQQVVLNVLLKAFDAMKDGSSSERTVMVRADSDGAEKVKVSVSDCGIGLGRDKIDKIFQPFYTTKHGGLGMGPSVDPSSKPTAGGCGRKTIRAAAQRSISPYPFRRRVMAE